MLTCPSIVYRALQGIGSAGVYTLTLFSLLRLVPRHQYDLITAITAAVMTSGLVLGPLAGGAIDTSGAWRWIFLLKYVLSQKYYSRYKWIKCLCKTFLVCTAVFQLALSHGFFSSLPCPVTIPILLLLFLRLNSR